VTYHEFERRAVRNYVVGTLASVVPAFAFYSVAFEYTPEQLTVLAQLAVPGLGLLLAVDILALRALLRPIRPLVDCAGNGTGDYKGSAAPAEGASFGREVDRLLAWPTLVLPRIFGLHAVSATLIISLLILWVNRTRGTVIPESDFPLYWFLNLTVVPVAHAVYEYHASERLIQEPLARLVEQGRLRLDPQRLVRLPLARRLFLFSGLLAIAPLIVVSFIFYQRWQASGQAFPPGLITQLIVVGAALILLWMLLLGLVSREVGEQTAAITHSLERIAAGDLGAAAAVRSTSEFGRIALAVNEMAAGLRERQRIRDLFGAYLTEELAAELLAPGRALAAERRRVTVLFVDLRDFTALSSAHPIETVLDLLNQFFREAVAAITAHRGHVNKFLGDGVLAVFGAPNEIPEAADRALSAALEIQHRLRRLNEELAARELPLLRAGAALHTGEVLAGTIGVPERKLEYTVIGEAVNLTARLEALNKQFGSEILLSQETASELKRSYALQKMPPAEVRGIPRPVEVFTLASK